MKQSRLFTSSTSSKSSTSSTPSKRRKLTTLVWEYNNGKRRYPKWKKYNSQTQTQFNDAFENGEYIVHCIFKEKNYTCDLEKKTQTNDETGYIRTIRCFGAVAVAESSNQQKNAFVIAITGCSQSGKSKLANYCSKNNVAHPNVTIKVLKQDKYRIAIDANHGYEETKDGKITCESSRFTNWRQLETDLLVSVEKFDVVIIEGYSILWSDNIVMHSNLFVWLDVDASKISERRPSRYPRTYCTSKGWKDINSYVDGAVIPEHQKYEHHVFQSSHLTAALFNNDASLLCRIPSFDNDANIESSLRKRSELVWKASEFKFPHVHPKAPDSNVGQTNQEPPSVNNSAGHLLRTTLGGVQRHYSFLRQCADQNVINWKTTNDSWTSSRSSSNSSTSSSSSDSTGSSTKTVVRVVAMDTLKCVSELTREFGLHFAVLNMANAYIPGGAYTRRRATAQEESLLRRTDIHFSLDRNMLRQNSDKDSDKYEYKYSGEYTDLINGRNGRVLFSNDEKDLRLCVRLDLDAIKWNAPHEIFGFYELRSAAVNLRNLRHGSWSGYNHGETRKRIAAQLETLIEKECRHVVLSAFGCGKGNFVLVCLFFLFLQKNCQSTLSIKYLLILFCSHFFRSVWKSC